MNVGKKSLKWFAHRGIRKDKWHDNTIKSITKGFRSGAMGVEVDIQLRGASLIVGHDNLEIYGNIHNYHTSFNKILEISRHFKDKTLLLDVKGTTDSYKVAQLLDESIREDDNVLIGSFNQNHIIEIQKRCGKKHKLGLITSNLFNINTFNFINNLDFISIDHHMLDQKSITNYKNMGLDVYSWVLNENNVIKKFNNMGVDGIITDIDIQK